MRPSRLLQPGSYLTITHLTADFVSPEEAEVAEAAGRDAGVTYAPRSQAEVTEFFSAWTSWTRA